MGLQLSYVCVSHVGRRRRTNQDNFICDGRFAGRDEKKPEVFYAGTAGLDRAALFGVFDGMGGGEYGEEASLLAASRTARAPLEQQPRAALETICIQANEDICSFAAGRQLDTCGTTAAMLLFARGQVTSCNLGDSRIFRIADRQIRQVSQDHVMPAPFGRKPPLLQYLGIPPEEMHLCPACGEWPCRAGDRYLICSDGLTDMLSLEEIGAAAREPLDQAARMLLDQALDRGGRDNITMILLDIGKTERGLWESVKRFLRRKRNVV